jgi:hypothetical protein
MDGEALLHERLEARDATIAELRDRLADVTRQAGDRGTGHAAADRADGGEGRLLASAARARVARLVP